MVLMELQEQMVAQEQAVQMVHQELLAHQDPLASHSFGWEHGQNF
jgi:hypothetical protein